MSSMTTAAHRQWPEVRRLLGRYRAGLTSLSIVLIVLGLTPLAGLPRAETAHILGLLGCQLLGLSLTLGNALAEGGLRGFLRAQALALGAFACMRSLYLIAPSQPTGAAMLIEILIPGVIAASFLFLRSRL